MTDPQPVVLPHGHRAAATAPVSAHSPRFAGRSKEKPWGLPSVPALGPLSASEPVSPCGQWGGPSGTLLKEGVENRDVWFLEDLRGCVETREV